jgi:hypothetical protein
MPSARSRHTDTKATNLQFAFEYVPSVAELVADWPLPDFDHEHRIKRAIAAVRSGAGSLVGALAVRVCRVGLGRLTRLR